MFRKFKMSGSGIRQKKRGSVLIVSAILMVVAGISTTSWLAFVAQAANSSRRDQDRMHAFYAAEAGIEQVVHYFNEPFSHAVAHEPEEYTEEFSATVRLYDYNVHPEPYRLFEGYWADVDTDNQFRPVDIRGNVVVNAATKELLDPAKLPNIREKTWFRIVGGVKTSKIPTCELLVENYPHLVYRNSGGQELARVSRILLINPLDFAAYGIVVEDEDEVICKVVATGTTPLGVSMTVESIMRENPTISLASPGAIISWDSAAFSGQFNVFWGEIWTKGDVNLKNNWENGTNGIPNETQDKWFKFRTEGRLRNSGGTTYCNGAASGGYSATAIASSAANYYQPYLKSTLLAANNAKFKNYENLYQHNRLKFPEFDYNKWKKFFLKNNLPYYFTDSQGNLHRKVNGVWTMKSYDDWFNISPTHADYNDTMKRLAFIDTIPTNAAGQKWTINDGYDRIGTTYTSKTPDKVNGTNMADIKSQGSGIHTRGAMIMAANFETNGGGNPPAASSIAEITKPDGTAPGNWRVNHNGMIYVYGAVKGTGNLTIYGSIFAENGYQGTGAREVYYNYRMRDGSWLPLNQSWIYRTEFNVKYGLGEV